MKYWIETNEVWPEYTPRDAWEDRVATIEIPDDFMARYNAAATEWAAVQSKLAEYEREASELWRTYRAEHACKAQLTQNAWGDSLPCGAITTTDGRCPAASRHLPA